MPMAVIWQKHVSGNHYQVRSAGATRRLYCNGVFHSQFNARTPLTGHTWDLLMIPAFFLPREALRRVLVLGVGGGTVIRQLQHFRSPQVIIGVERNPVHLYIARRFFGIGGKGVSLREADAVQWLTDYSGVKFDMIIDDLFGDEAGEGARAVAVDTDWLRRLTNHLKPNGVLVANFSSRVELVEAVDKGLPSTGINSAFQLTTAADENAVGVFLPHYADSVSLRKTLKATPGLDPTAASNRLNYRIRRLYPKAGQKRPADPSR